MFPLGDYKLQARMMYLLMCLLANTDNQLVIIYCLHNIHNVEA
jgi:hypothetical protein